MSRIPCHLLAGPLGVGKTSAIQDYLLRHADRQRVGVLVNDIGPFGLDGAMLDAGLSRDQVVSIPGGCLCCTLYGTIEPNLEKLIKSGAQRILIEPSGLAAPNQMVDLLRSCCERLGLEVKPVIVLLNAADFRPLLFERMPYFHVLAESADVLVWNRCDKATPEKLAEAKAWSAQLDPPKLRVLYTQFGQIPDDVFEGKLAGAVAAAKPCTVCGEHHEHEHDHAGHEHHHHHHHAHGPHLHDDAHADGVLLPPEECFDAAHVTAQLQRIAAEGVDGVKLLRFKAILHSSRGWHAVQIANGELSWRDTAHRRDNRLDWITQGGKISAERMLTLLRPAAQV